MMADVSCGITAIDDLITTQDKRPSIASAYAEVSPS